MKALSIVLVILAMFVVACTQENTPITGAESAATIQADLGDDFEANVEATFEITIENLAPVTGEASSQIFSPPVITTHSHDFHIFRRGEVASSELYQIAEDAVNAPMVDMLSASAEVYDVVEGSDVIPPGTSATYTVTATSGFTRLSIVSMLVNTNDAFTGITYHKLNKFGSTTVDLVAYDAGSEENTELLAHIPGPCCNNPLVRVPTSDPVSLHHGITGVGDLDPEVYGWDEPVARLTITRIDG